MSLPPFSVRIIPILIAFLLSLQLSLRAEVIINEIMYHPPSAEFEAEPIRFEYIELYNRGASALSVKDWEFVRGITITLPDVTLPAGGFAIVAADPEAFTNFYGELDVPVMGPWEGKLSNSGERLELLDAAGSLVDELRYADEGDWAERRRGPLDRGHQGWVWFAPHDGMGRSLEVRCPSLTNASGLNWGASTMPNGTPGIRNSLYTDDAAPIVGKVTHQPAVPTSSDPVVIQATIEDRLSSEVWVNLFYRRSASNPSIFESIAMRDDGQSNDGAANDGVYAVELPAHPSGTVLEFYVRASDQNLHRTWPTPTNDTGAQEANALLQFDDEIPDTSQATYRLIFSIPEENEFRPGSFNTQSDAAMNVTFIAQVGGNTDIRYRAEVRPRGNSSRNRTPLSVRISIPSDQPWEDLTELNINAQYSYLQALGMHLIKAARLPAPDARLVQMRMNGVDYAVNRESQVHYGSYVHMDPLNDEFVENEFPNDADGNLYKKSSADPGRQFKRWGVHNETELVYQTPGWYRTDRWTKESNASEEDWSDLQAFIIAINEASDATYLEEISQHVNIQQWLRWFAILNLINHRETALSNGIDDDYSMYRGEIDRRFVLLPHDLDTLFGLGDTATTPTATFFQMIDASFGGNNSVIPQLYRFFDHPVIHAAYLRELHEILNGVLHPDRFNPIVDHVIGHVPEGTRHSIKSFMALRREYVLSQITRELGLFEDGFGNLHGYRYALDQQEVTLFGSAPVPEVTSVRVQGRIAVFQPDHVTWQIHGVALFPGINRITIEGLNDAGEVVDAIQEDILSNTGPTTLLSGPMGTDRTLSAQDGPYLITEDLLVTSGAKLTIEAGTSLFFKPGVRLIVEGSLVAEGEKYARIRFTSEPTADSGPDLPGFPPGSPKWGGIHWRDSFNEENRIAFADIDYAQHPEGAVHARDSRIELEEVSFNHTHLHSIGLIRSELLARSCAFPEMFGMVSTPSLVGMEGKADQIRSFEFGASGEIIIEDCHFGMNRGRNAHIRLDGTIGDGVDVGIYGNTFEGSDITQVELGDVRSSISGNAFFLARGLDERSASAIRLLGGSTWIVGNVFSRFDHAITPSLGTEAIIEHNTFFRTNSDRLEIEHAVFSIRASDAVSGLHLRNNLFSDVSRLFTGVDQLDDRGRRLQIRSNLFPDGLAVERIGNSLLSDFASNSIFSDEVNFLDAAARDFRLLSGNGVESSGPQGQAIGAEGERFSVISNVGSLTPLDSIEFTVSGSGAVAYQYRVDGGVWSDFIPIGLGFNLEETVRQATLELAGLAIGEHTVDFRGQDILGRLQETSHVSYTWTISPEASPIRINEILASNATYDVGGGRFPDLIEIYNSSSTAVSLNGFSLSDEALNPQRFRFPSNQTLGAGAYLVLTAESSTLGFALSNEGEVLSLYRSGNLVDRVEFGPQLDDYSLARSPDGLWRLGTPTFGARNDLAMTVGSQKIRINEWYAADGLRFQNEFIELYNPSTVPAVLDGLSLTNDPINNAERYRFPPHSFAPANGFVVLSPDPGDLPVRAVEIDFNLNAGFESITLEDESGELDRMFFQSEHEASSSGRWPDGGEQITRMAIPTPGKSNLFLVTESALTLIDWNANWRYDDLDRNWGIAWRGRDFIDNNWSEGSGLLAMEDDFLTFPVETLLRLNPPTTHYFRHTWTVDSLGDVSGLNLEAIVDDGAVFYLNGNEIARIRMPDGSITHQTFASQGITNSAIQGPYAIDPDLLVEGVNVLAVSVHQDDRSSSDVVFGARLSSSAQMPDQPDLQPMGLLLEHLRITEIMYHSSTHPEVEWIELLNSGSVSLALEGVRFTDGIDFIFPEMSLAAGARVLVVTNKVAFESVYGEGLPIAGEFSGRLDNQGESIALTLPEPHQAAIVRFEYEPDWYSSSRGGGATLILRNPGRPNYQFDSMGSWRAGYVGGGTPGHEEMVLTSATHLEGSIDDAFSYQIATSNPATHFETRGLPRGLSVDATTGLVSGTPQVDGTFVVEIEASGPLGGISTGITINIVGWGPADHFTWDPIASPQWINDDFEVTLTARDARGRVVEDYDRAIDLIARQRSQLESGIVITEVNDRFPRFIEVRNATNFDLYTAEHRLILNNPAYGLHGVYGMGSVAGEVWSFPEAMRPNEVIVISEEDGWAGWGTSPVEAADRGWAAIITPWGFEDMVAWGYEDQILPLLEVHYDHQPLDLGDHWIGAGIPYEGAPILSLQRTGEVDRNRAMGWGWLEPTKGQDHPLAAFPMNLEETYSVTTSTPPVFDRGVATFDIRVWINEPNPVVLVAQGELINASFSEPFQMVPIPDLEMISPSRIEVLAGSQLEYQVMGNYEPYYYGYFNLPQELALNENTGLLSGEFSTAGNYYVEFYLESPRGGASALLEIVVLADSDGDGISDQWESVYGMDIEDPLDALSDRDGDGMTAREEFVAGTDPTLSESQLEVLEATWDWQGNLQLRWQSVPGRWYRFWAALAIDGELQWEVLEVPRVQATSAVSEQTVPNAFDSTDEKRFFRIEALFHGAEP